MSAYHVMCRVSGGVTGTREGLLKEDGRVRLFATFEEADAEAKRIQASMGSPYSLATFRYWPVEAPGSDPNLYSDDGVYHGGRR